MEVIRDYGEEKWAARIARIICEHRAEKPFETTFDLVHAVDAAIPKAVRRKDDGHPARRTFQAIRIAVNDELKPLEQALKDLTDCLKPGGRICVITFHSLEDRIVKRCFKTLENPCICPPKAPICTCGRKPVVKVLAGGAVAPSKDEIERNPRSRSAKLRVAEKRRTEA
jgi:16S rRNA (cytosine1402-N4)-methyltransferase